MLVLNIVLATGSTALGDFLHGVLTVVSAPMLCCGSWALSCFVGLPADLGKALEK